jgi:dipeptidyl aminopeptidase/acylaminoacyl peptidase
LIRFIIQISLLVGANVVNSHQLPKKSQHFKMKKGPIVFCFLSTVFAAAQVPNRSPLSIDAIMKGEDFIGTLPSETGWSEDSRLIYFQWNPDSDTLPSTYQFDRSTRQISKLTWEEEKERPEAGDYTRDYSFKVYEKQGDLFLTDLRDFTTRRITRTTQRERDPHFSGNGGSVIYREGDNLFRWDRREGSITQLTNFSRENERQEQQDEQDRWLEQEEMDQFGVLQQRRDEKNARAYRQEKVRLDQPREIPLGNKRVRGLALSPDQRYAIYQLVTDTKDKPTIIPDYITRSGYTTDLRSRPKVGAPSDRYESWIFDLQSDTAYRIETDQIGGIYDKPAYLKEYASDLENYQDRYDKPREVVIGMPLFSEEGKAVVNIVSQDFKDRWIMLLELSTGKLKQIDRQHDEAWIGGPGIGWMARGEMGWIDEETLWFKSEKTGFSHLYSADVRTGKITPLTRGEFEVLEVSLSRDRKTFYLISNEKSPHERHFYHLPATGGKMIRITSLKGGHEVTLSPDEKWLAVRYSTATQPWELYLMPNVKGAEMDRLTRSTTDAFSDYPWREPEIIRFKARDGVEVPASLYLPARGTGNGAAVIFVHGAGYLQNVHSWWPSYYREHMFHNLLTDNGYTVLAIDFRGSAGYGRDWRTAIYRHMGGKDLDDQVDGAAYLVREYGISPQRIGIYGGSYGGFITLMAMFKYPGIFASGAALRSVTDWAHYNHGYTAAILNTPVEDSLAYVRSSPIYYAEGLEGDLLMLHGMIDTNVHFQDIVRLSQRLIELKKEHWDLAVFPLEGHGFEEPSSWSDEYRRIFRLFQETLNKPENSQ